MKDNKTEEVFERIAKAGKTVEDIHPHEAHEGEIEERFKKMKRGDTLMQTYSFMQPYMKVKKSDKECRDKCIISSW